MNIASGDGAIPSPRMSSNRITKSSPHACAIVDGSLQNIKKYQSEKPLGAQESARIWRHTALKGVELFRGSYKKYQAARHFHGVPAIGVVARGAMNFYCRGAINFLPSNTIFLMNPEEVHAPGPAIPDGWVLRVFYFEDSFYRARCANFALADLRFSQVLVQDRVLSENLLTLHRNLEEDRTALEAEASLLTVFSRVAERYSCAPARVPAPAKEHGKIKRVKDYVAAHHRQNITLDDLAAAVQFSPYHLLRTFRSTVGLTPHAYLTQVRVEAAKRLLRAGHTIANVAAETGFSDQSHFTRHFKRLTGVTPARYHGNIRRSKQPNAPTLLQPPQFHKLQVAG